MVYCSLGSNQTNSFTGFDVEMIRLITKRLNLQVVSTGTHERRRTPATGGRGLHNALHALS